MEDQERKELNEEILKLNQINTTLNDEISTLKETQNNLKIDLNKKDIALSEVNTAYMIEKKSNEKLQNVFNVSQRVDAIKKTDQELLEDAFSNIKESVKPEPEKVKKNNE